jgi:hypothetical protein
MENSESLDHDSCASSLSGYHSERSPSQLSESPSADSWISWRCGGNPAETAWQTIARDNPSPISCDSGAFESDAGSLSTTDGWSSETSDRTDDASGQDFENIADVDRNTSENVLDRCQSPRSQQDFDGEDSTSERLSPTDVGTDQNDSVTFFRKNVVRRRPRKQRRPKKSANRFDPGFKGVVLKFKTKIDTLNCRSKLRIRSYYR